MKYGLIFWGSSSYSDHIFKLQKKIIRIITGISNTDSCRRYFKNLKIFSLKSQYILSIIQFIVKNKNHFQRNNEIHNNNTRHSCDFHLPSPRISVNQKGVYYMGIRIFNSKPSEIKVLSYDIRLFNEALKKFLYSYVFYSL